MIKVYNLGKMDIGFYETVDIIGRIEKIKIMYGRQETEDMNVQLKTNDNEIMVDASGAEDSLFYPRNWNVANERYIGVNVAMEGQSVMNAERYLNTGKIQISIDGSQGDYIDNIQITADVDEPDTNIILKDEGMVTTQTNGAFNPVHDRRRRLLKKYAKSLWMKKEFIDKSEELTKSNENDLKSFIEEALYTRAFDGQSKKISELIKDFMLRSVVKNYPKDRVMNYLKNKGIDTIQANNIYRTETQALKTKVREWSYLKIDPEGELKYHWLSIPDNRRTHICSNITERTKEGVTMKRLKDIIKDEVEKAKGRGELPVDYENRDWNPHFSCRSSFVRAF